MTPQEFKEKQKALGLNNNQMAECLGVYPTTVTNYRSGRTGIPVTIIKLLAQANKHNKHDNIKTTKMTPQEFKEKQKALGWTNNQMAKYLGVSLIAVFYYQQWQDRYSNNGHKITGASEQAREARQYQNDENDPTRVQGKTKSTWFE